MVFWLRNLSCSKPTIQLNCLDDFKTAQSFVTVSQSFLFVNLPKANNSDKQEVLILETGHGL